MSLVTPPPGFVFMLVGAKSGKKHLSYDQELTVCGRPADRPGRQTAKRGKVCTLCWNGARGDEPQQVRFMQREGDKVYFWKGEI